MDTCVRYVIAIVFCALGLNWPGHVLIAQEPLPPKVSVLESRVSNTTPIEGERFRYFLKFDYAEDSMIYPVNHFADHGVTVVETRSMEPQVFEGRVIQQYEYTLTGPAGEYDFSPILLQFPGPVKNPIAAQVDPLQFAILPTVEVAIESNSPIMLNDPLTVRVVITKRKPVTITALPHEFQADFQIPAPSEQPETETSDTPTLPPPPSLQFKLGDSPQITSQEVDGHTVDTYTYDTLVAPVQAGVYIIPSFVIGYRTVTGDEYEARTPPETTIFVLHPNTENLEVATDYRFLIIPAIVIGTILLAGIAGFTFLQLRKKRQTLAIDAPPSLPPGDVAHKELAEIQVMSLLTRGEFKTYYSLVSEAVRKFLGAEFEFHVLERTTEEVMQDIHRRDVPPHVVDETARFLREADMVKFAKYIPLLEEAESAMQHALTIVDESVEYHQEKLMAQPESQQELVTSVERD